MKPVQRAIVFLILASAVVTGWGESATDHALDSMVGDVNDGLTYAADETRLVLCDSNAVAVTIKEDVELIYGNAFSGCTRLLRVHFLGDAPNVAAEAFAELPRGCTIYVDSGRKGWASENSRSWKGVAMRSSDEIKAMPMEFDGQIKINEIWYKVRACGDGVELIANPEAMSESQVKTLVIPEEIGNAPVRILGDSVFPDCTNLVKVVIPASVTNFSISAFSRCGRPKQIEVSAANPKYRMVNGVVYDLETKTVIMAGADVSAVKVPDGAFAIAANAFNGCDSLVSVALPATIRSIGKGAFAGCMGLSVITIPAEADVAEDAFSGCCARIKKVGTYVCYDGLAGVESELRWFPDSPCLMKECPLPEPLPLRTAVERASTGDGAALYALAIYCARGGEVAQNPVRALEYLRKAVAAKDANAEFLLGLVFESRMAGSDLNDPSAPGIGGRF